MNDHEKTRPQLMEELNALRQQMAKLQGREANLRSLVNTVRLGIAECDLNGVMTLVNSACAEMNGYSIEEMVGMRVSDLLEDGPQRETLPAYFQYLVSERPNPTPYLCTNIRKDGQPIDVQVDWTYKHDSQGKITGFVSVVSDITSRKKAQESLRQSNQRLLHHIQQTPLAAIEWDVEARVVNWNPAAERIFGYSAAEALGQHVTFLVPPQAQEHVQHVVEQLRACRGEMLSTNENVTKDGRIILCEWYNTPLVDSAGEVMGAVSLAQDITERNRAEKALRDSEVSNRALLSAVPDLLFRIRMDGTILGYTGREACLYVAPEQFLHKKLSEVLPPQVAKTLMDFTRKAAASGAVERCEYSLAVGGECRWWESRVVACGDNEVLQVVRDISVEKWAVEALRKAHDELEQKVKERTAELKTSNEHLQQEVETRGAAERALRQAYDQLHSIYEGMTDGILIADLETLRFYRVNNAICRMLGYSEEELYTLSVNDLHPTEAIPFIVQNMRKVTDKISSGPNDIPFLRKDGSLFYVEMVGRCIQYDGRQSAMGIFRDITERKQAEEQLAREHRAIKHLLQASDHERQVIAYEIHDGLAQYLAAAIMQFDVFDGQKASKPEIAANAFHTGMKMLKQGHSEARRIISGVRAPILDEAGIVAAVAHLINEQRAQNGPQIQYLSNVVFDRLVPTLENAVYRIVQEGLTNACKHSQCTKVRVTLVQKGELVRIKIRDNGVGFERGNVDTQRFGLRGIHERARLLGGKCRIESKPGKGTRITVELPVVSQTMDSQ